MGVEEIVKVDFVYLFDIIGVVVFAISGALSAMNKRFDLFGVAIIAAVTAIGGGTIRDLLLGDQPVVWLKNAIYPTMIFVGYILALLFRKQMNYLKTTLFIFDTIGLGLYTIMGIEKGLAFGIHPVMCIFLGVIAGTFGGVLRDILCNDVPLIFHKEIYALASVFGGILFIILRLMEFTSQMMYVITVLFIIVIRIIVVKYNISLPNIRHDEDKKTI